jgi:DNA-binding MarR family transcriptional regulator
MGSIKEVLSKVSEGKTVKDASKELNVRESTLRAMIDFMVEKGYLEELGGGGLAVPGVR